LTGRRRLVGAGRIAAVLAAIDFSYSAVAEEYALVKQFPDAYPACNRSTKMLIPFVFCSATRTMARRSDALGTSPDFAGAHTWIRKTCAASVAC
jgi:hypothetical protein